MKIAVIHRDTMEKIKLRCDMCEGRGKLWLSGKDYLECPQCLGSRVVDLIEQRVKPKCTTILLPMKVG